MTAARSGWLRRLLRRPGAAVSVALLAAMAALSVAAPLLFRWDAFAMVGRPFLWPGDDPRFPLGTDMVGRDILVGLVYGARVSLLVGAATAILSTALGVLVGALAGYFGGWVDHLLMRVTELFQTMPSMIFAITVVAILQPSVPSIVAAIGLTSWPQTARLVRAETLRVRESEFVQAGAALGFSHVRLLLRHVLPNAVAPAVVMGAILAGSAILTEAALSFLGLGDPNVVSWGSMIGAGRQVLRTAPYVTAIPGLAVIVTVLAVTALGNGLGLALNPRERA